MQLGCHPVAEVQYTFTHKQYIDRLQISQVPQRILLNILLHWKYPCLRYESNMESRTMQNIFHLEDVIFSKLCLKGLT